MARSTKINTQPKILARPPVVTILGHVDHGKTTLLDSIRHSHVVTTEHGGITQHIGAYQVYVNDQSITFIDTPGHAAFAKMRARGAQVTDIVILVIAANDGVKPQTVESIRHIKEADVPMIVAINKIDLDSADPETVKSQLAEHEVFCEGFGGQVPTVNLSAKTGQGIPELLDMILLVAQMQELTSHPEAEVNAVVIESSLDKHRGSVATAIVKTGTLKAGDTLYVMEQPVRIRQLLDDHRQPTTQALPGQPVEIVGFKKVLPPVGSSLTSSPQIPVSPIPLSSVDIPSIPLVVTEAPPVEGDTPANQAEEEAKPHFNLLLKADTAGTLEAISNSLSQSEITLVGSGVGPITESDVLLASDTKAVIIGFSIPLTPEAKRMADREGVRIKTFTIIYELLEYLEDKVLELLEPTIFEQDLGTAQVISVFTIRGDHIAGCQVRSGKLTKGDKVHVVRRDRIRHSAKIISIKQGKQSVKVAKSTEECGLILDPSFDFRPGDMIKSYKIVNK